MYASSFLSGASRMLWHAHKKAETLTGGDYTVILYDWQRFVDCCQLYLDIPNRVEIAFAELDKLRQTGTVADFKAKFEVLAIRAKLPAANQLFYWYRGLKPELRRQTTVDPLTSRPYTSIKAAAQTYDSCYGVSENATATAHTDVARGEQHKSPRHRHDEHRDGRYEPYRDSRRNKCGICDSTYHASFDCPKRSQPYTDTDIDKRSCFVCGKTGHIARDGLDKSVQQGASVAAPTAEHVVAHTVASTRAGQGRPPVRLLLENHGGNWSF